MKKFPCLLLYILLTILFSTFVTGTGIFPIIEIEKDFNRVNIFMNVYNPPVIPKNCSNGKINCSNQFSLILPQWLEPYEGGATIYEPRRYFIYNPDTSAELVEDCRKFFAGGESIADIGISRTPKGYEFRVYKNKVLTPVPVDWSLSKGASNCYLYKIPIYNPQLVDQKFAKYYPFDIYETQFGFSFPYQTDFQGLIIIPEEFTIINFSINTTQKISRSDPTKNIGYFNFKPITNEKELFFIRFSRIPDIGSKFLIIFILLGLPLILVTFFLISSSPEIDTTRTSRIIAFYLAIVPLFLSMITFLNDKPDIFTLFDAFMTVSIIFLILNVLKDFLVANWFESKILRRILSAAIIIITIIYFSLS